MAKEDMIPGWFNRLDRQVCERMDVRPLLASGRDPLAAILAKVDQMAPDAILQIETPFDPLPLHRLMAGRGYTSHPVQLSENHWQVFFCRQTAAALPDSPDLPNLADLPDFSDLPDLPDLPNLADLPDFPVMWQDGILDMDLRGLVPPNPMVAVLRVIESGAVAENFTVWLDRDPVHLYPELVERHWQVAVLEDGDDGVRATISRVHKHA